MSARVTTYKNSPILLLQNEKFPLALGVAKCKLILDHVQEIADFVSKNTKVEVKQNA